MANNYKKTMVQQAMGVPSGGSATVGEMMRKMKGKKGAMPMKKACNA